MRAGIYKPNPERADAFTPAPPQDPRDTPIGVSEFIAMVYAEFMSVHISAQKGEISDRILLPGDPLRAKWVAENWLTDVKQFNAVRNMFGYTGIYKGERISVMGTGMGLPSISIYVTELFNEYDVQIAIRIGTAGGFQANTKVGDVILAMTASTDSNINRRFTNNLDFAPHADFLMLQAAYEAAKKHGGCHVGGVSSMDYFYDETDSKERLRDHGVLAVEMEASALYSIAARKKRRALAILTVSDHVFTHESMDSDARERSLNNMVEIALSAINA